MYIYNYIYIIYIYYDTYIYISYIYTYIYISLFSITFHWFMIFILLFQWFLIQMETRPGPVWWLPWWSRTGNPATGPKEINTMGNPALMLFFIDKKQKHGNFWEETLPDFEEEHDYDLCHDLVAWFQNHCLILIILKTRKWTENGIVGCHLYHVESMVCPLFEGGRKQQIMDS